MEKTISIIIIAAVVAVMIFLITLIGFWALVLASFVGVAVAMLIERIRNRKKKENESLTQS
jgi:membrane protein implicated in regulation of membrane protease activity